MANKPQLASALSLWRMLGYIASAIAVHFRMFVVWQICSMYTAATACGGGPVLCGRCIVWRITGSWRVHGDTVWLARLRVHASTKLLRVFCRFATCPGGIPTSPRGMSRRLSAPGALPKDRDGRAQAADDPPVARRRRQRWRFPCVRFPMSEQRGPATFEFRSQGVVHDAQTIVFRCLRRKSGGRSIGL